MPRSHQSIVHITLVGLALIGLLAWARASAPDPTAAASNAIRLDPARFDFGAISMRNGPVRQELTLRNTSYSAVNLTRLTTSCMCTKAELTLGGETYGPFGMPGHGVQPSLRQTLAPGASATLAVTFDPAAHGPAGVGRISRTVTLETDAGSAIASFTAQVLP